MDLRIAKGIRKPTYSTSLPFHSSHYGSGVSAQDTFGMGGGEEEYQHSAPVVQVESVSTYQVQYARLLHVFLCLSLQTSQCTKPSSSHCDLVFTIIEEPMICPHSTSPLCHCL